MTTRKTPILLRRGPMSGEIQAIYAYKQRGDGILVANGKQSVQADYDHLVLEELCDPDSLDIASILDGVADGRGAELTDEECQQVRTFRERLVAMMERHNARLSDTAERETDHELTTSRSDRE